MICMIYYHFHDLDLLMQIDLLPILHDLAHVARWEAYNLHDLAYAFLGWICTIQILHNLSQRQVRNLQ